ncbi:PadR family transcriptional regulator [Gemmatimonadota bacterium]
MTDRDPGSLLPLTPLTFHILLSLADIDRHGYGIIKEVAFRTGGEMELETGTLYAALKRIRDEELIEIVSSSERPEGEDSRRRTYRLTPFGLAVLRAESERLSQLVTVAIRKQVIPVEPALGEIQ